MYMVHNGHLAEPEWKLLKSLASTEVPVLTLAPHVTASIAQRGLPVTPDWILPVYPFKEPDVSRARRMRARGAREPLCCAQAWGPQSRRAAPPRRPAARPPTGPTPS